MKRTISKQTTPINETPETFGTQHTHFHRDKGVCRKHQHQQHQRHLQRRQQRQPQHQHHHSSTEWHLVCVVICPSVCGRASGLCRRQHRSCCSTRRRCCRLRSTCRLTPPCFSLQSTPSQPSLLPAVGPPATTRAAAAATQPQVQTAAVTRADSAKRLQLLPVQVPCHNTDPHPRQLHRAQVPLHHHHSHSRSRSRSTKGCRCPLMPRPPPKSSLRPLGPSSRIAPA